MSDDQKITFDKTKKFDIQLSQGLIAERRLAAIFTLAKIERVELKTESWLWERTRNLCIEFARGGVGSGITTTEADYWVHELMRNDETLGYFMIPVERLRRIVAEERIAGHVKVGGDDGLSHMVVIPITDLLR
jgi:hypothetical protein